MLEKEESALSTTRQISQTYKMAGLAKLARLMGLHLRSTYSDTTINTAKRASLSPCTMMQWAYRALLCFAFSSSSEVKILRTFSV